MREWLSRHRHVSAPLSLFGLLLLGGCGAPHGDPHAHAGAPADARHCNDLPFLHGDPGLLVGSHWSSDRHAWGEAVTVYACADPGLHGSVRLSASDARIRIRPAQVELGTSPTGVYRFEVTPPRGSTGELRMDFGGPEAGFSADTRGPRVAADGDGWHFAVPPH